MYNFWPTQSCVHKLRMCMQVSQSVNRNDAAQRDTGKESMPETIQEDMQRVECSLALRNLTQQEIDACVNCVHNSNHSKLTVLPNHSISHDSEFQGFVFECHSEDLASVLPVSTQCFGATCVYECEMQSTHSTPYLQLVGNLSQTAAKFAQLVCEIKTDKRNPLTLECMPDYDSVNSSRENDASEWSVLATEDIMCDQCEWREEIPAKFGLYHCFMRTNAQNLREHKVFIVISGNCQHATEEIHKLWLDAGDTMTAGEFVQSPEVTWLRQATLRHHNRLASRVANAMGMSLQCVVDMEAVGAPKTMLLPTASCFYRDISLAHNKVLLSSDAALLHQTKSGVVFDCFSNEGFWVFMGPRDYSSYKIFGSEFCTTSHLAFPTKAVCFHDQYVASTADASNYIKLDDRNTHQNDLFITSAKTCAQQVITHNQVKCRHTGFLFPHALFIQQLEKLGFVMNDGIANLMPIVMHCTDE